MTSKKTYLLSLDSFDLEFDVDLIASVEETRVFGAAAPEGFLFAVGSVWVRHNDSRYLVSGEFNSGNLAEWMKAAAHRFSNAPPLPPDLAVSIGSQVCHWFLRYWDRINSETIDEDDETTYDRLFPYCILAENNGCIALFSVPGSTIVQVCAQGATMTHPICFEARLHGSKAAARIEHLRASVGIDVLNRSKHH
jgi:hypothetical protein